MSKVYDKPDRSVAILWECEKAPGVYAAFCDGILRRVYTDNVGPFAKPVASDGRWRPYQPNNPEPWPPKKLMPRRCWATYRGTRMPFVWFQGSGGCEFRWGEYMLGEWLPKESLTNIVFIDPEQEAVEVGQ